MIHRIVVPSLADEVKEVRVLEWHYQPGQHFEAGELIVELETHKVVVEVRSGRPGWLRAVLAVAGEWARLDGPIALVSDADDEALPDDPAEAARHAATFAVDFTLD